MAGGQFDFLELVLRKKGATRTQRAVIVEDPASKANRTSNRITHASNLENSRRKIADNWASFKDKRKKDGIPEFEGGIPLLLKVDPGIDLDQLRHQFEFEIVSEEEDGYAIVASETIDLSSFEEKLKQFAAEIDGAASAAKIHAIEEDLDQSARLLRILGEDLFNLWPTLNDDELYVYDISVTCLGTLAIPKKPSPPKRAKTWKDATWARKQLQHSEKVTDWARQRALAYERWDDLKTERCDKIEGLIHFYKGNILSNIDNSDVNGVSLPDSFTLRVEMVGKGFKDVILNESHIFEVAEPEDFATPQALRKQLVELATQAQLDAPPDDAPKVCVIDSGIQEEHLLLQSAIDSKSSKCFLPKRSATDVTDQYPNGGHGTRVAGAVLYGSSIKLNKRERAVCWIQNARVLNEFGSIPKELMPAEAMVLVVNHFHLGHGTRIFNQSINVRFACRTKHMSAWAAQMDQLSNDYDILFVQSVGNLPCSETSFPKMGVQQLRKSGKSYPEYLKENICRVANPAQSLQAIAVGSVSTGMVDTSDWVSFATQQDEPSAFSRSGLGIWQTIKPEVVEYGGDFLENRLTGDVSTPPEGESLYPELVRCTLSGGPGVSRDNVGTSFAAPKVARIAAALQSILPDSSCLLYRALIIQSAKWPSWANELSKDHQAEVIKRLGYGIPDLNRATTNTDYRVTLTSDDDGSISPGESQIFQVRIPQELRRPGSDFDVRIDVTLSYSSSPRRTRRRLRGYLSVTADWTTNRKGETPEAFLSRSLKDEEKIDLGQSQFPWVIHDMPQYGLPDIRRAAGTVQKDWAVVRSNQLPEDFCIAVRGRKGWSTDPDAQARFALVVTFEVEGQEIPILAPMKASLQELKSELTTEVESELELEIEEELE